jgi:hypothetical protein
MSVRNSGKNDSASALSGDLHDNVSAVIGAGTKKVRGDVNAIAAGGTISSLKDGPISSRVTAVAL